MNAETMGKAWENHAVSNKDLIVVYGYKVNFKIAQLSWPISQTISGQVICICKYMQINNL